MTVSLTLRAHVKGKTSCTFRSLRAIFLGPVASIILADYLEIARCHSSAQLGCKKSPDKNSLHS